MSKIILQFVGVAAATVTRAGFHEFYRRWLGEAERLVAELIATRTNADFNEVRDLAYRKLKEISGEARDTWIILAVSFAWNFVTKPRVGNWFKRVFGKVWGWIRRLAPFTADVLEKHRDMAIAIVRRIMAANTNKEFKDIVPLIEAEFKLLFKELDDSSIALLINFAYEAIKAIDRRE